MVKAIYMTVKNRLLIEKRDLNIYHRFSGSAHMISYNSSITLPVKPSIEGDYLHISVVSGPGNLEYMSVINLPSWVDFEFYSESAFSITHSDDRTLMSIPSGIPPWQLRVTCLITAKVNGRSSCIIVSDELQGLM